MISGVKINESQKSLTGEKKKKVDDAYEEIMKYVESKELFLYDSSDISCLKDIKEDIKDNMNILQKQDFSIFRRLELYLYTLFPSEFKGEIEKSLIERNATLIAGSWSLSFNSLLFFNNTNASLSFG